MQKSKNTKRGRPTSRRQDSQQESSESYSHIAAKKKQAKKNAESKKEKDKQSLMAIKKSKSRVQLSSVDSFSDSEDGEKKYFKIPIQIFVANQVFSDILDKANRQPQFLIMLKNLLSGCYRLRQDKKSHYRKKWKLLRNSNCTQNQYLTRQSELKRLQAQQIGQIQDDIISKLALANIRGFQTQQSLLNNYKLSLPHIDENIEYMIDQNQWNKYRQQQKKLLQILMNQNDFVSQDYKLVNLNINVSGNSGKYVSQLQPTLINKQEENQMELKFNSMETEENQESIQFLFCKNYNNINIQKVFDLAIPFKVSQQEKYYIDSKAMSWLLESKCDQIYTNQQFQKQTYQYYSKILLQMYENPIKFTDSQIMHNVLEAGAYILNSVHYYQKFKLKCELLHPLDLLLVAQKISSERNKRFNASTSGTAKENIGPETLMNVETKKGSTTMIDERAEMRD